MNKNITELINVEILKYLNLIGLTKITGSFLISILEEKYRKIINKKINLWSIKFFFISKYKDYLFSEIVYSLYKKIINSRNLNITNAEEFLMGSLKYCSLSCIKEYLKKQNLFEESLLPIELESEIKDFSTPREINMELSRIDFINFINSLNKVEKKLIKDEEEMNLYSTFKRNIIIRNIQNKYNNYLS
ncbi:hypothetical protein DP067_03255 [Mycoplasmopsis anatis]|uniref:Uncharacterized protein n=1 Tax=Mycoplasmopsis anatis 1340 TaxID=1034808 RepID=F9QE31_9BACT|nr:hypothetical protein [Mycoplasmopsis anatis]AWX70350.1 hypothetical protein DP067_03255 [Mycoplasmopsis anatis]EGS28975.1 hypothetical protein GIG_03297 [Mycoplasmopsis anatis 1340]VEU74004.1 Uncharacterised protein [Mycoplasmopsis anatis]